MQQLAYYQQAPFIVWTHDTDYASTPLVAPIKDNLQIKAVGTESADEDSSFDDAVYSKRCRFIDEIEFTTRKNLVTKRGAVIYVDEKSGHQYLPHDAKQNKCGGRETVRTDEIGKKWLQITVMHGSKSKCHHEGRSLEAFSEAIDMAVMRNEVLTAYEQHAGSVKQILEKKLKNFTKKVGWI